MNSEQEHPQRKRAASPNKQIIMRDAAKICKSERENHLTPASEQQEANSKIAADGVDIQDNRILIWHYHEPSPG
jgi:hypothetical protein